jgi:aquaporin Z
MAGIPIPSLDGGIAEASPASGVGDQIQITVERGLAFALKAHWPEYLMESAQLGLFMVSACVFTTILEYPLSPVRQMLPSPLVRNGLSGLAMALTLVLLIHSRWGKRSGAHMNPAITLMFLRLKKLEPWDGVFYILSQFAGGLVGVVIAFLIIGRALAHPNVSFAATHPGTSGVTVAFMAELLIAFRWPAWRTKTVRFDSAKIPALPH